MRIVFVTENFMRGGIDVFLINLIKNWPAADEIILLINKEYEELKNFEDLFASNKNVSLIKFK